MWTADKVARELQRRVLAPMNRKGLDKGFNAQFEQHFPALWDRLIELYGERYDFLYQLEDLVRSMAEAYTARSTSLRELDQRRTDDPHWFARSQQFGVMLYVDLFCGELKNLEGHLNYLADLGVTLVHLMPLFRSPEGDSDGGYAVSDYQQVNPALGSMDDLARLAEKMRTRGMSLALDFILNHTADNHAWAEQAKQGSAEFRAYYFVFDSRAEADQYDRSLREIFPKVRRGSFTYVEAVNGWVWTTFNSFQWDLNYRNPAVFRAMAEQMLFLANQGAEVLRLDALAFCWKEKGSVCESLAKAHTVIQAFKAVARIVAPALTFLSEAIVHPDEVVEYIGPNECELSYNPLVMATTWEALATRKPALLGHSLDKRYSLPRGSAWVNYLRCHDDIGWTFSDEDARDLGIDGYHHRHFLNQFYTGRFPGSFARGVPFQENPETGDARICGTLASLAGLEKALTEEGEAQVEIALKRMLLLWGFTLSLPGIPLLYAGDEVALLNDYGYLHDPAKAGDSRWVHRQAMPWQGLSELGLRLRAQLSTMIALRKTLSAFSGTLEHVHCAQENLLAFRCRADEEILVIANFSENALSVSSNELRLMLGGYRYRNLLTDREVNGDLSLGEYGLVWLQAREPAAP